MATNILIRAIRILGIFAVALSGAANAEPLAAPGDLLLRHDLQLLNDSGVMNIPLTAWPVALGDVHNALVDAESEALNDAVARALRRVRNRLAWELDVGSYDFVFGASASSEPRVIRTFENTPRADAEAYARLSWVGEKFAFNLSATYADNPFDGDEVRPDGTYVGVALGQLDDDSGLARPLVRSRSRWQPDFVE